MFWRGLSSSATTTLTPAEQRIYDYVSAHRDGATYLMAVGSWSEAGQYIPATGQEVMDLGGSTATAIDSWVASACAKVPAQDYSTSATATAAGAGTGTLYMCSRSS